MLPTFRSPSGHGLLHFLLSQGFFMPFPLPGTLLPPVRAWLMLTVLQASAHLSKESSPEHPNKHIHLGWLPGQHASHFSAAKPPPLGSQ